MEHFILISGKAASGKDTTAKIMKNLLIEKGYRVLTIHYADLLKFICRSYFHWDGKKDLKGRTLLQKIGTDCVRAQNPNYWVDFVINFIKMFPNKWDYIIIPDVRFLNEISRIKQENYMVTHIRVLRSVSNTLSQKQKKHISETALDSIQSDYTIVNDGDFKTLQKTIIPIISNLRSKK